MSTFEAVRARWESSRPHASADSPNIPLLRPNMGEPSSILQPKNNAVFDPGNRLTTSLSMLNKPLTSIRNRAFSKSSKIPPIELYDGQTPTMPTENTRPINQNMARGKENKGMIKSQTTSFLPLPTKVSSNRQTSVPSHFRPANTVTSLAESRKSASRRLSRPSYLPRSTTHPNFGTTTGRRASELPRRNSTRWPLLEDTRPLLRSPFSESPMLGTPSSEDERQEEELKASQEHRQVENRLISPTNPNILWDTLNDSKSYSGSKVSPEIIDTSYSLKSETTTSPQSSPRVIHHHHLLQPIQPLTPLNNTFAGPLKKASPGSQLTLLPPGKPFISPSRPVFSNRKDLQRPSPLKLNPVPTPPINAVSTAQPNAYWSGRFIGLNDKLLNDSFDLNSRPMNEDEVESSSGSSASVLKAAQPPSNQSPEYRRAEKIFQILNEACTTDEARRSLLIFKNMYAIKTKMLEFKCDIPPTPEVKDTLSAKKQNSKVEGEDSSGGTRKFSFMGRLRARKSSAKSILMLKDN